MSEKMSSIEFGLMSGAFFVRDIFSPPRKIIAETEIKQGDKILDYACGIGSYSFPAAEKAGNEGMVYSLDILPIAVKKIDTIAQRKKVTNLKTICSKCETGLKDNSIDAVLFFDAFHLCDNRNSILKEHYRVLKPNGKLYFSDHHMEEKDILKGVTQSGLFSFEKKGRKLYVFEKKKS